MIGARITTNFMAAAFLLACVDVLAATRVLDDLIDANAWTAVGSDDVDAHLRIVTEGRDHALCLDFNFNGVSGYAALRRELPIDYPADYAFTFRVRGHVPQNTLQFKLTDASGDNVWWHVDNAFVFPQAWQAQRIRKRDIDFAWGPTSDKSLRQSQSLELTIYAGKRGHGDVCFDRLALETVAPAAPPLAIPIARATSSASDSIAANATDADALSAWRSGHGGEQSLTLDFGAERDIGGVVLHWLPREAATRYDIEISANSKDWRRVRRVVAGNGGTDPIALRNVSTRYLRIVMHDGESSHYAISAIDIEDPAFGASANAFFAALAQSAPRGRYPRGFYDEQTYWTIVGVDGGHDSALLSEDGALEVGRGGFSIEPFLLDASKRSITTWADAAISQSLYDDYLPMPSVTWHRDDIMLTTSAFAVGGLASANVIASYRIDNNGARARSLTLALALRPFQVNPSIQFLNTPGGVSPIKALAATEHAILVDGNARVFPLRMPDAFVASSFDAGMIVDHLADAANSSLPALPRAIDDATGLASGALLYRLDLAPHASRTIAIVVPLAGAKPARAEAGEDTDAFITRERKRVAATWHAELDRVGLRLPASAREFANTLRTALADILISRNGAALRPGTRAYARSWIRDGTMMSETLLRLGHADVARSYLDWYAPHQFNNGKVPCCVDERGSDPVAENDSEGELIHLAWQVYRYTRDERVVAPLWPRIEPAIAYMDVLRATQRTPANRAPDRRALYGLMPASISHEGYSAKPMHSYWDDFWALTGYKDATSIAQLLGKHEAATAMAAARDQFRDDLLASITAAVNIHAIDYLPGAAELGDFDPTSTTIALTPAGEQSALPQDLLLNTFERYWREFVARRDGATWTDYTPYEWRNVGAFVRLGWRERAQQAIAFFMRDRRPAAWNQWAEVVGRNARESRFIGDMPHGWVASDFIGAALDLFAYEREADQSLVLAAGIPARWLDDEGFAIERLRTPFGLLSFSLRHGADGEHFVIGGDDLQVPRGGFVLSSPDAMPGTAITVVRGAAAWHDGGLRITAVPAELVLVWQNASNPPDH